MTVAKLWLRYYSVGGELEEFELDGYLHGIHPLPLGERNMIALALNELIDELPCRPRADVVPEPLHG